ncbi:uncharacterized protein RCC_08728 [Ramularia collo-cygni]|uniref:Uncharacterized protein n=1 Tax=Ramularia collo-cygni TaxID=112498 RepID=A0A2D3VMX4_9PEZI|nr:uncharacterized protein RCC_08728 [Ramularia collo-cygni]CZT23018.1 uncharacterized protein RCC_08728 [Ramularia collo-cygni]
MSSSASPPSVSVAPPTSTPHAADGSAASSARDPSANSPPSTEMPMMHDLVQHTTGVNAALLTDLLTTMALDSDKKGDRNSGESEVGAEEHAPRNILDLPLEILNKIISLIIPRFLHLIIHSYGDDKSDLQCTVEVSPQGISSLKVSYDESWADVQALFKLNSAFHKLVTKQLDFDAQRAASNLVVTLRDNLDPAGPISLGNPKPTCLVVSDKFLDRFIFIRFDVPLCLYCERGGLRMVPETVHRLACYYQRNPHEDWQFCGLGTMQWARRASNGWVVAGDTLEAEAFDNDMMQFDPHVWKRVVHSTLPVIEGISANIIFESGPARDLLKMQGVFYRMTRAIQELEDTVRAPGEDSWRAMGLSSAIARDLICPFEPCFELLKC